MRVPALVADSSAVRLPLAAFVVSLLAVGVVALVPGPTSGPVVLTVGFGPTAGGAMLAGARNAPWSLLLLGLVPLLTLVLLLTAQSLRFGPPDEMIWLVSVVVFVAGLVVAGVGFALGRGLVLVRAWVADRS